MMNTFSLSLLSLVANGASCTIPDHWGNTALHEAAWNGEIECCLALLAAGAELTKPGNERKTAADLAEDDGYYECASLLVSTLASIQFNVALESLMAACSTLRLDCDFAEELGGLLEHCPGGAADVGRASDVQEGEEGFCSCSRTSAQVDGAREQLAVHCQCFEG